MSVMILNVLCEGQTEEKFVKDVLRPYLRDNLGIVVKHRLLMTSKSKDAKGGLLSYTQAMRDLKLWMKEAKDNAYEKNAFTTMFDLYALPTDFPQWEEGNRRTGYERVEFLENALAQEFGDNFIPYIQLHEFEALVFCGLKYLRMEYPQCVKEIDGLEDVLTSYGNPEKIDNSPHTAPSKRIMVALKDKYRYDKVKSGTVVTSQVGVDELRGKCRHFNDWLLRIEKARDVLLK